MAGPGLRVRLGRQGTAPAGETRLRAGSPGRWAIIKTAKATYRAVRAVVWVSLSLSAGWVTASTPPPKPLPPLPSERQLQWHKMEMNAFVHFGINTFTDREWGTGQEDPALFNPTSLDCRQWVRVLKSAGFRGVILTAKHHDGFCLWPSRHTDHSVKASPWRSGKGDVVGELASACREAGLKFGIYLSPWDRHEPTYGDSPRYNEFYKAQLRELLTQYGEIFEVWFDGACGEGPNGKRQVYDWDGYWRLVRELQPNAVIFSDGGPDVRWVGNERGFADETNWPFLRSGVVFPGYPRYQELQQGHPDGDAYVPAEADVSIRPGWFYHSSEDGRVKSLAELVEIYFGSVGRGANLLLNVPPDPRGLIHENDAKRLAELGTYLQRAFHDNLALRAKVSASNVRGGAREFSPAQLADGEFETYWATDDSVLRAWVDLEFDPPVKLNCVGLQEMVRLGQRIRSFQVLGYRAGEGVRLAKGTTIGYKRLLRFARTEVDRLRIEILDSRACPVLAEITVYDLPPLEEAP
ncbi:MAG: alpha-L-fucosidase [candidate division KSB1 bacterium]|nr:alpha-L-fucosidase [candidate division KSB1 bacterium]